MIIVSADTLATTKPSYVVTQSSTLGKTKGFSVESTFFSLIGSNMHWVDSLDLAGPVITGPALGHISKTEFFKVRRLLLDEWFRPIIASQGMVRDSESLVARWTDPLCAGKNCKTGVRS